MVVNVATPTEQTSSSIDSRGTMGKQGSSQSSSAANQSSSSITPGKLRRQISVPIEDRLEDPTAVQRLVEYFVVVSCKPRLDPASSSKSSSPPKPQKEKRDVDGGNQAKKTEEIKKKMHDGTKRFNESIHNAFKKREVTGAESAIRRTFSEEPESREEALPPPQPRNRWKKDEQDYDDGNIRVPESFEAHTFQPKITARYPAKDHVDNPLNPMITHFCYPVGDVIVPTREYQMPKVHHFVLTNEKGKKVYGNCLTFYEEYVPPEGTPHRRKEFVHDTTHLDIEVTVDEDKATLYLPRCLCILSFWPYVTAFREYLAQLYRLATASNCMTAPIERYIMNICMEIPAPPPGAFEVQVNILDSVIRFWSPPAKLPIAYVALPYRTLFDCLDTENILHLWYCLTMESKVLLVSSQYSLLTICSEILCSLLYPMKWSHLYVPILPRFLCPMLDAPVPYLCGITRENWLHVQQFVSEETIVVDLDRNSVMFGEKTMEMPAVPGKKWIKLQSSLEEIAGHLFWQTRGLEKEYREFTDEQLNTRNFKRVARQKGDGNWAEKLDTYDQAFNLQFTPDSENLRTDESIERDQKQWDRIQEVFLRFFVATLKKYRNFLQVPDAVTPLSPPPGSNDWMQWSKRRSFDRDGFLTSQKPQYLPYLIQLCTTQMFDDFITKRLYNPEMPDVIFFDQSIDAKLNRSRLKLTKIDTPFLQSARTHKSLKTFLAVEPNTSDLSFNGPFIYESWPETFDSNLFCKPRPIPNMITAEFDRQASLITRLRQHHSPGKNEENLLMLFYGSDFDGSPEGMAFTVFFFTYAAVIGREWRDYQLKKREMLLPGKDGVAEETIPEDQAVVEEAKSSTQEDILNAASDLTLGMCDSCPDESDVHQTVVRIMEKTPCPQYTDQINSQAHEAYSAISKLATSTLEQFDLHSSLLDGDDDFAEYEEAREVAAAQLDLAFDTLKLLELRGLMSDPDVFRSLMEACGRCGDTKRALELIEMMKRDGLVADKEILSCFMAAFSNIGAEELASGDYSADAYSKFLWKKLETAAGGSTTGIIPTGFQSDSESDGGYSDYSGSEATPPSSPARNTSGRSSLMEWFVPTEDPNKKKRRKRKKNRMLTAEEAVSDRLTKQIVLGESLLDFLYPDLSIDTNGETCLRCSHRMTEIEIVDGWLPCEFQDFTTACPQCKHRFVPKFTVTCTSPYFEGSQGSGTPLFCEFLSPWVLRKELNNFISVEDGIDVILDPQWRAGTGIKATLWWNMIAMLKRYRLPFSFLLQGSFQNRLISPVPQD